MERALLDTLKSLLVKYPYIYLRYHLEKAVAEMGTAAADNVEQIAKYDEMIKIQTWVKDEDK
jgi:hypothetical protein